MRQLLLGLFIMGMGTFCLFYVFNGRLRRWYEERHQRYSGVDPNGRAALLGKKINLLLLPVIGAVFVIVGLVTVIGAAAGLF